MNDFESIELTSEPTPIGPGPLPKELTELIDRRIAAGWKPSRIRSFIVRVIERTAHLRKLQVGHYLDQKFPEPAIAEAAVP